MEDYKNNIYDRVIVNNHHDFIENDDNDVSANYVILCEENTDSELPKAIYEYTISGLSLAEWVAMACESKPSYVTVYKGEKFLNSIKPYIGDKEYTVVLYADTPLVSKTHLKDLLGFVSRKRLNVCKLKRGFILKNDYIAEVDEIYSSLVYDLSSNDFFEVKTFNDIDKVKGTLQRRMFNYHKKNGVIFESQENTIIDANVKIGYGSIIAGGVSLLQNTVIGKNVTIDANAVINNSKIEDNSKVSMGTIIENSILKNNTSVGSGAIINYSVVGENVMIGVGTRVVSSALKNNSSVNNFSCLENVNVLENAKVGKGSMIIGEGLTVAVEENSEVQSGTKIIKKN